jgi:hypothetical protein
MAHIGKQRLPVDPKNIPTLEKMLRTTELVLLGMALISKDLILNHRNQPAGLNSPSTEARVARNLHPQSVLRGMT